MRQRSNAVWYVVIGVLAVALAGALAFAFWPRGESEDPPSSGRTSSTPSPTQRTSEPDPEPSESPTDDGGSSGGGDDRYGPHPPAEVLEELFPHMDGFSGKVPVAPELNGWKMGDAGRIRTSSTGTATYVHPNGAWVTVSAHLVSGNFARYMEQVTNHRQIGVAVCGDPVDDKGKSACAVAARDSDITAWTFDSDEVSREEMAALLEAAVEFYRSERP